MNVAVVAGGWHWPLEFFFRAPFHLNGADLFVIAHRNPELPIVREEKLDVLAKATGPLADLDRELYADYPTVSHLRRLGWHYEEAPNTIGDWQFFNQWLAGHDYRDYDVILNCHDDTYMRPGAPEFDLSGDWLLMANGTYPGAPECYVRGSFEFWKRELLDMIGGHIDLGPIGLTREGKTDTPEGMAAISEWNNTALPLRRFMSSQGLANRIKHLSPYYRISPYAIEGERGFMHSQDGVPWSFAEGLKAFPLEVAA